MKQTQEKLTLFKLAQIFYNNPETDKVDLLTNRLRLTDYLILPLTQVTGVTILELPEEVLPYYTQCQDTIALIALKEDYLEKIKNALEINKEADLEPYLPKIYLIHRTDSVTIKNTW